MTTVREALVGVMQDVGAVAKRDRNNQQNFNFRGIDAVVNAVSPALIHRGVVVTPEVRSVEYASTVTTKGAAMTACRVVVAYTFTGPDGDSITATVPGEAFDSGDKATPKAMSVAFRTALLQALALPTDEPDPDSFSPQAAHPPKDWNSVLARASQLTARDALEDLWRTEGVGYAPEDVRAAFTEHVNSVGAGA